MRTPLPSEAGLGGVLSLAHGPFKKNRGPLTLPSPPVGERVAKGGCGAAAPYPKLGEGADAARDAALRLTLR